MHGIFLIDKAAGYSSAQVIGRLRRRLGLDRIGHAGTLDPFATGLLVALVGRATRLADFVQAGVKTYSGEFLLGTATDTEDITGTVISNSASVPAFSQVLALIPDFTGKILQTPPRISAVKVDGARAYARARQGQDFELEQREVCVESFEVSPGTDSNRIFYRVRCSKGTYIRSLARDIGLRLGCGACVYSLRREVSGHLLAAQAKPVDEICAADLIAWEKAIPEAATILLSRDSCKKIWAGDERALQSATSDCQAAQSALLIYGCKAESPEEAPRYSGVLRYSGESWQLLANIQEPAE